MYENSKIISFAIGASDGLEKAYRNSYFCKKAKGLSILIKNIWRDSVFGRIIDNIFNIETHKSSLAYRLFTKPFIVLVDFLYDKLSLEQGISNSRYINIIRRSLDIFSKKSDAKEGFLMTVFKDSIFVKCAYQFWEGMD